MSREDILLKEYETCQSHNNALGNESWINISVLITVNLLVLGQVVAGVLLNEDIKRISGGILVVVGLVLIFIICIFKRWKNRVEFQTRLNNLRMRDIETVLEMRKNWRVYGLDLLHRKKSGEEKAKEEWQTLTYSQQEYIKQLRKHLSETGDEWEYKPPTTKGCPKFSYIFPMLISLWAVVIILGVLTYCPFIRECLFKLL